MLSMEKAFEPTELSVMLYQLFKKIPCGKQHVFLLLFLFFSSDGGNAAKEKGGKKDDESKRRVEEGRRKKKKKKTIGKSEKEKKFFEALGVVANWVPSQVFGPSCSQKSTLTPSTLWHNKS